VVRGVAALVTSATGDEGTSQRHYRISLRNIRHALGEFDVRENLTQSAWWTTACTVCAKVRLGICVDACPARSRSAMIEGQLSPKAAARVSAL
jgi:hypothetical protein